MAQQLRPSHGPITPMARVYLYAGSPRSQWARTGFFPRTSEELLSQHPWTVLDCGRESGSYVIIKTTHWIINIRVYLPLFVEKIFIYQSHKVNIHIS